MSYAHAPVVSFLMVQSPGRHHYFLLMPLLGAGLAGLCLLLARRLGAAGAVSLTLLLALGGALASAPLGGKNAVSLFAGFQDIKPRQQADARQLAELSRWLARPDNASRRFCLVASGVAFNQGMFSELWQVLPGLAKGAYSARMVRLGQVDSVGGPPWPGVRDCEIFLVAVPFQAHLRPDQQSTLEIVQKDIVQGTGIGRAVAREAEVFPMGGGVEVRAYRTLREITPAEYQDLVGRYQENKASVGAAR